MRSVTAIHAGRPCTKYSRAAATSRRRTAAAPARTNGAAARRSSSMASSRCRSGLAGLRRRHRHRVDLHLRRHLLAACAHPAMERRSSFETCSATRCANSSCRQPTGSPGRARRLKIVQPNGANVAGQYGGSPRESGTTSGPEINSGAPRFLLPSVRALELGMQSRSRQGATEPPHREGAAPPRSCARCRWGSRTGGGGALERAGRRRATASPPQAIVGGAARGRPSARCPPRHSRGRPRTARSPRRWW